MLFFYMCPVQLSLVKIVKYLARLKLEIVLAVFCSLCAHSEVCVCVRAGVCACVCVCVRFCRVCMFKKKHYS